MHVKYPSNPIKMSKVVQCKIRRNVLKTNLTDPLGNFMERNSKYKYPQSSFNKSVAKAAEGIRTLDVQLGKLSGAFFANFAFSGTCEKCPDFIGRNRCS